ncbi:hypothetical protein FCV25MIE_27560 [Fagus crenata]
MDSYGDVLRRSLGASELSIVPPIVLEVAVLNNPSTEMEEGEICGDSQCFDVGEVCGLNAEELTAASGALEVENTLSMVEYREDRFPLDSHEQQCMALLQSIEVERLKHKSTLKMKQPAVSVRKGACEL